MIYRIFGGIFLVLFGISLVGFHILPDQWLGVIGLIGGAALLAGQ